MSEVLRLARLGELHFAAGEERTLERREMHIVDARPGSEVYLRRPAVIPGDPERPEPVQEAGVVAVPEERLRVCAGEVRIQVRDDRDLVVAADRREHGADGRVAEGRVEVGRPVFRTGAEPPGRGVLDHTGRSLGERRVAC